MSMLAERKRKQKWCLNPRGNLWSDDQNKFGKRLLEKMGWKDGKGLGAKEDGAIEHVKVSYKNDSKGMGFKENGEQWTEHEDHFTQLLKSLGGAEQAAAETEKPALSGQSLEKKSKAAKSRVHYHKFTRGKDLSRYSEKDLANIFGKKTLKTASKTKGEEEDEDANGKEDEGEERKKNKFGVETLERGSMVDYFRQKLPHFSSRGSYEIGANGVLQSLPKIRARSESESETEQRGGFGFGFGFSQGDEKSERPQDNSSKMSFVSYVKPENCEEIESAGKDQDPKAKEEPQDQGQRETKEDQEKKTGKDKRKKKRKLEQADEDETDFSKRTKTDANGSFVNPAFDPLSRSKIVGVKHSLTTIAEEKIDEDEAVEESHETSEIGNGEEASEIKETPKQKKDRKPKMKRISEAVDEQGNGSCFTNVTGSSFDDEADGTQNEGFSVPNPYEVKRKSAKKDKKRKLAPGSHEDLSYCNEVAEEATREENCSERAIDCASEGATTLYEVKRKIKKSKKKTIESEEGVARETTEDEKKSKKGGKKDKKNIGLDNPSLNVSGNSPSDAVRSEAGEEHDQASSKGKKKRLKKSESSDSGLDNPALNLSVDDQEETVLNGLDNPALDELELSNDCSNGDQSKSKVKRKKTKSKSLDEGLDNPALNLSVDDQEVVQKNGIDNPALELEASNDCSTDDSKTKTKKKKTKSKSLEEGLDNPGLNLSVDDQGNFHTNGLDNPALELETSTGSDGSESKCKVKKKKSKSKSLEEGLDNPALNLSAEDEDASRQDLSLESSTSETSKKSGKRKSKPKVEGLDNPALNVGDVEREGTNRNGSTGNERTEKKRKRNKNGTENAETAGLDNPTLNLDSTNEQDSDESKENAGANFKTPKNSSALPKAADSSAKRKKSVRFSEVTEERIIPNVLNPENNAAFGLDNEAFDLVGNVFTEGVENLNQALDEFQNELENDMNEKKLEELEKRQQRTRETEKPVKKKL